VVKTSLSRYEKSLKILERNEAKLTLLRRFRQNCLFRENSVFFVAVLVFGNIFRQLIIFQSAALKTTFKHSSKSLMQKKLRNFVFQDVFKKTMFKKVPNTIF